MDRLAREVLAQVLVPSRPRDVRLWLEFLAEEAVMDVRQRLLMEGWLAKTSRRTALGLRRVAFVPTNANHAAWPAIELADWLTAGSEPAASDKMLASLVRACGLLDEVLWRKRDDDPARARAQRVRAELPGELAVLVAHTEAVIGDRILTARRGH